MRKWNFVVLVGALALPSVVFSRSIEESVTVRYSDGAFEMPESLILKMFVETITHMEGASPSGIVLGQLNQVTLEDGCKTIPANESDWRYSRVEGERFTERLKEVLSEVKARHKEYVRVIACPENRSRPSGKEVWLALRAAQELETSVWEEQRYQLNKEFEPMYKTLMQNYQPGYTSTSYDLTKLYDAESSEKADARLEQFCAAFEL